uniref:Uncharacterized protein n=1 Tax=Lepeophtheirus salmonis TaxID=72036 RepID=A0A0K2VC43_LEPSM
MIKNKGNHDASPGLDGNTGRNHRHGRALKG